MSEQNPRGPRLRLAAAVLAVLPAFAGAAEEAIDRLRGDVEFLASEELEGRLTGTGGERIAREYLAERMAAAGLGPPAGHDDLFHPFEFTAGTRDVGSVVAVAGPRGEREWGGAESVRGLSLSDNGTVTGEVVFAGYGLSVPASQDFGYDSYATLDVEGKIVLVLRYFPEDASQEVRGQLARYAGLRYKALQARERGARAILVVTGPRSPNAGETIPMTFDTAIAGSGIVAASIGGEVAEHLFSFLPDRTLEEAQRALDDANPHVPGFAIPGVELTLEVAVERERRTGHNVVGVLPRSAKNGSESNGPGAPEKPFVVIGAHYDHLGRGNSGNSLAKKGEEGGIHHGADDNASGVAAVLEVVERLSRVERERDLVVAFWSGEELGLLGSTAFVDGGVVPIDEVAAYVNYDMVGRVKDNRLIAQAAGSSPVWPRLLEQANVPVGFDLQVVDDPYLPTDSASFHRASVPTLNFFTGSHGDYHRPSDVAERINYEGLEQVARLGSSIVGKLLNADAAPAFTEVERAVQGGGDRDSVRAYTGTIPDYATEVEGLRLSGVIGGGPAEEAGLQEGDVIVEFGGQTIANIYDYTYALDAVKVDVPVQVVFLRDGERMEVTVTPRARK